MARPSLAGLVDEANRTETARHAPPTPEAVETPAASTKSATTPPKSRPTTRATTPDPAAGPRYLELVRKEARFGDDQLIELNILTRQLNKTRRGRGERITDNTLIRVAVDLLLKKQGQLVGHTEAELRKSVGL